MPWGSVNISCLYTWPLLCESCSLARDASLLCWLISVWIVQEPVWMLLPSLRFLWPPSRCSEIPSLTICTCQLDQMKCYGYFLFCFVWFGVCLCMYTMRTWAHYRQELYSINLCIPKNYLKAQWCLIPSCLKNRNMRHL